MKDTVKTNQKLAKAINFKKNVTAIPMEFTYFISKVIEADDEGFSILTPNMIPHNAPVERAHNNYNSRSRPNHNENFLCLYELLATMGEASAKVTVVYKRQ